MEPPALTAALLNDLFFPPQTWTAARRIEVRRAYASDRADPRWGRWANGDLLLPEPDRPWYVRVRELCSEGRRVERVRVIDEPETAGQRYLRWVAPNNVDAGEDIRSLPRRVADELQLADDTWLFEGSDSKVAILKFTARSELTGIEISRIHGDVSRARARWAAAWTAAEPVTG